MLPSWACDSLVLIYLHCRVRDVGAVLPILEAHSLASGTDDTTFTNTMTGSLCPKHQTSQIGPLLGWVSFLLCQRSVVRKQVAGRGPRLGSASASFPRGPHPPPTQPPCPVAVVEMQVIVDTGGAETRGHGAAHTAGSFPFPDLPSSQGRGLSGTHVGVSCSSHVAEPTLGG